MNQHTRIAKTEDELYEVFKSHFLANPMLANEKATGACVWPPEEGFDWVYGEAVDRAAKAEAEAKLRAPYSSIEAIITRAARDALAIIANAETDRREAEQNCIDYGPHRQQERV